MEDKLLDRDRVIVPVGYAVRGPDLRIPRHRWWPMVTTALLVLSLVLMVVDP